MTVVFVNYRRRDSKYVAGRLRDVVADRYGADSVFMDVDSIGVGTDYVVAIDRAVGRCDVMLVLIGETWLDARDPSGARRLDDPGDHVRLEIEAALRRTVPVIPVVIDSAHMPTSTVLPESLTPLSRYHASRLRHESFHGDARRIVEAIESLGGGGGSPLRWLAAALLLAAVVVLALTHEGMRDTVEGIRPFQPHTDGWLTVIWLLPTIPALLAVVLLLLGRWRGVAAGLVLLTFLWVADSALRTVMRGEGSGGGTHALLLGLLGAATVVVVAAMPELRAPVRANPPGVLLAGGILVAAAVVLRFSDVQEGAGSRGLVERPAFWLAWGIPVVVSLPAVLVRGTVAQAGALLTLACGEAGYLLFLHVLRQAEDPPRDTTVTVLVSTACMLLAALIGQLPRLRSRGSDRPS